MENRDRHRTQDRILREISALRDKSVSLKKQAAESKTVEEKLRRLSRDLHERIKELNCLYSISRIRDDPRVSWQDTLQGVVEIIPSAFQYPEITCARLTLPGLEFKTHNFKATEWKMTSDLMEGKKKAGVLEVFLLQRKENRDEGLFLKEERTLLEAIGERIEKVIERHREEERLKRQQQQLIHADKMVALGTLVSGVAHEINNPNNFIMLNTPLLQEAWETIVPILDEYYRENGEFLVSGLPYTEMREKTLALFEGIVEGSARIKTIVDSLKGFARVDSEELIPGVDINAVVKSALALMNNLIRRSTENFSVEYGRDLPTLRANFQRLEQVIINIVQNACEALPDKQKAISITTSFDAIERYIVVTVRDEGVGIPDEKLRKIQDPFYTTKRQSGGTGLGLSISSGIVKNHGGTLSFTSTPGVGTTAILTLPVADPGAENGGRAVE